MMIEYKGCIIHVNYGRAIGSAYAFCTVTLPHGKLVTTNGVHDEYSKVGKLAISEAKQKIDWWIEDNAWLARSEQDGE